MATDDFFHARLDAMIDLMHPLAVVSTRLPWAAIEAAVARGAIGNLPEIFRQLSMDKVRRRQRLDMKAFASVYEKRCF